jgi:predicted DNA-binding protein with PD1-like motif
MLYSEAKRARSFVLRLEDGEILHTEIENFCRKMKISSAFLLVVGGADRGSRLIVGPRKGRETPILPVATELEEIHEITGTGTVFPNEEGAPVLHMHISCGRGKNTITGCVREGVRVWHVMEVVICELTGTTAMRKHDPATGFELLRP